MVTQDQFLSVQIVLDAPGDQVAGLANCQVPHTLRHCLHRCAQPAGCIMWTTHGGLYAIGLLSATRRPMLSYQSLALAQGESLPHVGMK